MTAERLKEKQEKNYSDGTRITFDNRQLCALKTKRQKQSTTVAELF